MCAPTRGSLQIVCDFLFVLDLGLSFRIAFRRNGLFVRRPALIASRYLRGWFVVDFLGALPLDLIFFAVGSHKRWDIHMLTVTPP